MAGSGRTRGAPGRSQARAYPRELGAASATPSRGSGQRRSLARLLEDAAGRITRLSASEAFAASSVDGQIIDIRSHDARELNGLIPGSLHIPRTVLEWRIALDSPWRNRHLGGIDQRLILICDHGYSSVLAASNLVALGFERTCDVIGGFESWSRVGLPTAPSRRRCSPGGALPGTGAPD